MRRPIIETKTGSSSHRQISTERRRKTAGLSGPRIEQALRQRRSVPYVRALTDLDAGQHHANREALQGLIEAIETEFPELGIDQLPLGIVSRCYLGPPYVVHMCDLTGEILEHFESTTAMPAPYERARSLALRSAYAFIEVYPDSLRAVAQDGSVSVIEL